MSLYKILLRYFVFILGLFFLSAGVVLIVRSDLGTTPISIVNYVMSINTPFTLGGFTFVLNMLLILGQFWLIKGRSTKKDVIEILLQIPFSLLFSLFIDFNMDLTSGLIPANYLWSMLLLLGGCVVQSLGVVLEIKPRVAMMSAEAFVKYASQRSNREFGKVKVYFDIALVLIAINLSLAFASRIDGVREGSLIAACITGYIVTFLNQRVITRDNFNRLTLNIFS